MNNEVKFEPSACRSKSVKEGKKTKTVPATFKGSVTLRRPTFLEREQYKKSLYQMKMNEDGDVDLTQDSVMSVIALVEKSIPHYVSVDIEKVSDGTKYHSFEDLSYDVECDSILYDVATALVNGFRMGKS